jgi:hypothetical protein
MIDPKSTYVKTKESTKLVAIINPRLITGNSSENTSDVKPAIVVITAKKVGFDIDETVSKTSFF